VDGRAKLTRRTRTLTYRNGIRPHQCNVGPSSLSAASAAVGWFVSAYSQHSLLWRHREIRRLWRGRHGFLQAVHDALRVSLEMMHGAHVAVGKVNTDERVHTTGAMQLSWRGSLHKPQNNV